MLVIINKLIHLRKYKRKLRNLRIKGQFHTLKFYADYDGLVSGAAARIIKLAEDESAHRRQVENKALDANIALQEQNVVIAKQQNKVVNRSDILGQIFGFVICISCVGAAIYLGINGHDWLAGTITVIPSAAVIKSFFSSKNHQQ